MRPIDADALSKDIEEAYKKAEDEGWKPGDVARTLCAIVAAPTLDLEPVRRGRWVYEDVDLVCSECGSDALLPWDKHTQMRTNYCAYCGARMDLKERE